MKNRSIRHSSLRMTVDLSIVPVQTLGASDISVSSCQWEFPFDFALNWQKKYTIFHFSRRASLNVHVHETHNHSASATASDFAYDFTTSSDITQLGG